MQNKRHLIGIDYLKIIQKVINLIVPCNFHCIIDICPQIRKEALLHYFSKITTFMGNRLEEVDAH